MMDRAEAEIIGRAEAINEIHKVYNEIGRLKLLLDNALSQISERTGRWIKDDNTQDRYFKCSNCGVGQFNWGEDNYCPNCGVRMRW